MVPKGFLSSCFEGVHCVLSTAAFGEGDGLDLYPAFKQRLTYTAVLFDFRWLCETEVLPLTLFTAPPSPFGQVSGRLRCLAPTPTMQPLNDHLFRTEDVINAVLYSQPESTCLITWDINAVHSSFDLHCEQAATFRQTQLQSHIDAERRASQSPILLS